VLNVIVENNKTAGMEPAVNTTNEVVVQMVFDEDTIKRFWSKVDIRDKNECWPWVGTIGVKGYGRFWLKRKAIRANRMVWEISHSKKIEDGMFACHSCDNPSCVNPNHIWIGTNQDNQIDRVVKGRHNFASRTHCSKGHDYSEHGYRLKNGHRDCRICRRAAEAKNAPNRKPRTKKQYESKEGK
jgi:hypothetical protein